VEKNLRPFFGSIRAARISTDIMERYREKRVKEGCAESTANRELSVALFRALTDMFSPVSDTTF
jgi:hypothetical protein